MGSEMTLFDALRVLAMVHTREDYEAGYTVQWSPGPFYEVDQAEYVKAWGVVRAQLHMKVEPSPTGAKDNG